MQDFADIVCKIDVFLHCKKVRVCLTNQILTSLEPVAKLCEHGEAVRSMRRCRRSTGAYPPDRPPWSPAHHTEGGNHCVRLA